MITPSYATTATERVLPRMALDFTTGVLDPRVTVTRALNTATRVNSSGFVELVNANLPRFDYDPVTLAPKGLLIEESRTNLLTYSEQFDNAAWGKQGSSVSQNVVTSPDGSVDADKLIEDATTGEHRLTIPSSPLPVTAGTTFTLSVYAKAAERTLVRLSDDTDSNAWSAFFNLANGTIAGTGSGSTARITPIGNGWYRCAVTYTTNSTLLRGRIGLAVAGPASNYTGDGTSGAYIWGAQLEIGAFATSYIPTTTTSLTRNFDNVTMTGSNFSSWFTAGPGALYSEASQPVIFAASRSSASLCGSANNPRLSCYRQSAGTLNGYAINSAGAGNGVSGGASATANTVHKTVLSYSATNAQRVCANGNAGNPMSVDMTTSFGGINSLAIGSDFVGNSAGYCGHIRKIMWWPQQLTTAEAQAFSK